MQNQGTKLLDSQFTIFEISFGDLPGLPKIPIKIALPEQLNQQGKGLLADLRSSLSSVLSGGSKNAVWE
jgi:hypothetical protein